MDGFAALYLPGFVAWTIICGTYALAQRSWVDLVGLACVVNMPLWALWLFAPAVSVVTGAIVNTCFLILFLLYLGERQIENYRNCSL